MAKRIFICCVFAFAVSQPPVFAQTGFANMVDHIHLGCPTRHRARSGITLISAES